jgi:DNA polymerase I-like protein with 3'-5' exonuclease and polymerase domains
VNTLLGRRRRLPDAKLSMRSRENRAARNHALRAAINTPIQGSAADVASCAMISIVRCEELQRLGWTLLLQVGRRARGGAGGGLEASLPLPALGAAGGVGWAGRAAVLLPPAGRMTCWLVRRLRGRCSRTFACRRRHLYQHSTLHPQVHDEVILEGPKESAERAQQLVVQLMQNPFLCLVDDLGHRERLEQQQPLLVELSVDSNVADTWYEAK